MLGSSLSLQHHLSHKRRRPVKVHGGQGTSHPQLPEDLWYGTVRRSKRTKETGLQKWKTRDRGRKRPWVWKRKTHKWNRKWKGQRVKILKPPRTIDDPGPPPPPNPLSNFRESTHHYIHINCTEITLIPFKYNEQNFTEV